ncbi:MAG: sodium:calcium antiporter [Candidatus Diapherotrites archaeon]|nr:sodium:calcium antiporter [Candidatus Diapherotrites archaeon]
MLAWLVLIAGILAIVWAASTTIRETENLAAKLGWSKYGIASTLVAAMTSLPELIVSVIAARSGNYGIVTGTVFGSVVGLLLLSLGLIGLISEVRFNKEEKTLGRRSITIVVLVAILAIVFTKITWWMGIILLGVYLAYVHTVSKTSKSEEKQSREGEAWKHIILIAAGVATLILAAEGIVWAVQAISREYGVDPFVISFIIVAIGTNLPEITVEIVSTIKNRSEIAVGDILGSAVADTTLVLGSAAIVGGAIPVGLTAHIGAAILLGSAIVAWKIETEEKITMWEAVGLLVAYFLVIATEMALG